MTPPPAPSRRPLRVLAAGLCWLLGAGSAWAQGPLDPTFGTGGRVFTTFTAAPTSDRANSLAVQADGKLVAVGSGSNGGGFRLARYLPDGSLDPAFGSGGQVITGSASNDWAYSVMVQADQKLVVSGRRGSQWVLARYLPDGSLDAGFGNAGLVTLSTTSIGGGATKTVQQSSGQLVVLGSFRSLNYYYHTLRRYGTNGIQEGTFTNPTRVFDNGLVNGGAEQIASDLLVDGADRLLVLGTGAREFRAGILRSPQGYLARLLPDGSFDTSFGLGGVLSLSVNTGSNSVTPLGVTRLPSGQLLVVGKLDVAYFLTRLSADGVLDTSFGTNGVQQFSGFEGFLTYQTAVPSLGLAAQPDGKIVVHGTSGADFALARFNADGSPDTSFGVNGQLRIHEGTSEGFTGLYIQPDGKYLGVGHMSGSGGGRFALLRVLPTATCTAVDAGADRNLCGQTSTTLGAAAQAGLSYSWSVSPAISGFSSTSSQPTVALPQVSVPTVYTFTLTATATGNAQCTPTDQVQVTVLPQIDPALSAQASSTTVASGQGITLSVPNPQAAATYTWNGPGVSNVTGSSISVVPPGSGVYTVTASIGSCTRQAQVAVQVSSATAPNWAWARRGDGTVKDLVTDGAGNSYLLGRFPGTATFGSTQLVSQGPYDMFLVKYDPAGSVLWAKNYGGTGDEQPMALARDGQGNLYVTGFYSGSFVFGSTTVLSPGTSIRLFVAKLDAQGNPQWLKSSDLGPQPYADAVGTDLAVDAQGNLYVTGSASTDFIWDGTTLAGSGASAEVITLKLDAQGNQQWMRRFGGNNPESGQRIAVDAQGNVYVAGKYTDATVVGSTTLPANTRSVFLVKYSPQGSPLWAQAAGGSPYNDYVEQLLVEGSDVYLLTQGYSSTMNFGSYAISSGGTTPTSYLARYDAAGNATQAYRLGTSAANSSLRASGMALKNGHLYFGGWFKGTVNFSGASLSNSSSDLMSFVLKYNLAGTVQWAQQASSGHTLAYALGVDDAGNAYLSGNYGSNSVSFGSSLLPAGGGTFVAMLGTVPTTPFTWTGAVSSAWTEPGNWSTNQVPGPMDKVIIPGGLASYPVLSASRTIGSLDLQSGATLTQTAGTLNVVGDFTQSGTLTQSGGTLALTGTTPQTLGRPATPTTLLNLTVGPAGARLAGPVQVQGLLTLAGNLASTVQEPLTLLSNATGTAAVRNQGGVVTGPVTVQRYIDPAVNAGRGYRHLSSPVVGSTVADLAAPGFAPVVNAAYNTAANPAGVTPYPNVFGYNEQRLTGAGTGFDTGWESPVNLSDALTPGRGYTVNLAPQTLDFVGPLTNGTVNVPLTRGAAGQGWNLVGNPYPSPLDWDKVTLPAGVDAAAYVYRSTGPYAGGFQAYVNGVGAPGSQLLALGQAFFVRANSGTPTLTLTNAARPDTLVNPALLRGAETRPLLALALRAVGGAAGEDRLYVYQQAGATPGFDGQFDALKPLLNGGQQPSLYQAAGPDALSIQGLPAGTQPVALPVAVHAPAAGSFTLGAAQLLNFPAGATPYLEDRQTGTWHDLSQGSYAAQLPQGLTTARFVLHLYAQRPLATQAARLPTALAVYPNPAQGGQVTVEAARLSPGAAELQLHNALGQLVLRQAAQPSGGTLRQPLSLRGLPAGVYSLRLVTAGGTVTQRLVVR